MDVTVGNRERRGDSRGNSSDMGSMDETVWSQLPEDMMDTILARLPIPSLFRARTVCKRWEAVVRSPAFLNLCSDLPSRLPWYLGFQGFRHERGWAYDPGSGRWFNLDFSFLPPGRCAAAAGGLLCFCQDSADGNILYVCNPMTKVWRALPPFPGCVKQVAMSVDSVSKTYIVVVIVQDETKNLPGGNLSAFLYNKKDGRWRGTSGLPSHAQLNIVDAAFCGGVLYCLIRCLTQEWQFIKAYDLGKDAWSDLSMPMPNAFRSTMDLMQMGYLVEHGGKLLLVEKIIASPDISMSAALDSKAAKQGIKATVWVHELDLLARNWNNVGSLQNTTLCIGSFTSRAIHCKGSEKLIYFTNHGSAVNMYDASQGSWHRLPEFPRQRMITSSPHLIFRQTRCKLGVVIPFKGLWFEPRLDCIV